MPSTVAQLQAPITHAETHAHTHTKHAHTQSCLLAIPKQLYKAARGRWGLSPPPPLSLSLHAHTHTPFLGVSEQSRERDQPGVVLFIWRCEPAGEDCSDQDGERERERDGEHTHERTRRTRE